MEIFLNNKKIEFDVKKCKGFGKIRGLIFRKRENAPVLLFDFAKPSKVSIHSFFVFFPFIAVWLDDKNKILAVKKVKPWNFRILPKKEFNKLMEIPCNKKYGKIISFLVGEAKGLNTK